MNIINLSRLISSNSLTTPSVSSVVNFTTDIKAVEQGFCFISDDENLIKEAVLKGAYAIIFSKNLSSFNPEVAYFRVENLERTKMRVLKYFISLKELKFVKVSEVSFEILTLLRHQKGLNLLQNSLDENFKAILKADSKELFFGVGDEISSFSFSELTPNFNSVLKSQNSLFYSKFELLGEIFEVKIPHIFYPEIHQLFSFLLSKNIKVRLKDGLEFSHFYPIFVDKFLNIKEFGSSYKAFIVESSKELFLRESEFLKKSFRDGVLTISLKTSKQKSDIKLESLDEILNLPEFRYALVLAKKDEILEILSREKVELLYLFSDDS